MKTQEELFSGFRMNGILMLFLNSILLILNFTFFIWLINGTGLGKGVNIALAFLLLGLGILNVLFWLGFMKIEPNEARVMVFFGKYKGTVKDNGFFWVNPFYSRQPLTL